MDAVFSFFKGIVDLGAAVMLPIVLIIIGLFFRMKLGQAIKSGLMVGIGFQGLCLVVNLLTTSILRFGNMAIPKILMMESLC